MREHAGAIAAAAAIAGLQIGLFVWLKNDMSAMEQRLVARIEATEMRAHRERQALEERGKERLDGLEQRLMIRIDGLQKQIDGLHGRIDGVERRIDGIEKRIDEVRGDLQAFNGRLRGVEQAAAAINGYLLALDPPGDGAAEGADEAPPILPSPASPGASER